MTAWKAYPNEKPPTNKELRIEVWEKDRDTDTPEPYHGKPLFKGYAVFDGRDFYPFGLMGRLPIFWDGRLNAFGRKDVTLRFALWEE